MKNKLFQIFNSFDLKRLLLFDRWFASIMVLVLYLCAVLLVVTGIMKLIEVINMIIESARGLEKDYTPLIAANFISIVDIYLLAIVFYIFAIGIYKLLIGNIKTFDWLKIETIDDLKDKIAKMIVLFLTALFVRFVVEWKDPMSILYCGISISLICTVLVYYCHMMKSNHNKKNGNEILNHSEGKKEINSNGKSIIKKNAENENEFDIPVS